tara:strand:+ start:439 stop:1032 length:594 start_codon:yes stop_codon:yes gene_type:complete
MKILFFIIPLISSFSFKKNGFSAKYIPNKKPELDLKLLASSQALRISKSWMQNIIEDYLDYTNFTFENQLENKSCSMITDFHILDSINSLEKIIKENDINDLFFFAWIPETIYSYEQVLFLIVAENCTSKFKIKLLVQSPFWNPSQIESVHLKNSLEEISLHYGFINIDLEFLYKHDLRTKMVWSTMNLNKIKKLDN